jgi:hypothetical protein
LNVDRHSYFTVYTAKDDIKCKPSQFDHTEEPKNQDARQTRRNKTGCALGGGIYFFMPKIHAHLNEEVSHLRGIERCGDVLAIVLKPLMVFLKEKWNQQEKFTLSNFVENPYFPDWGGLPRRLH